MHTLIALWKAFIEWLASIWPLALLVAIVMTLFGNYNLDSLIGLVFLGIGVFFLVVLVCLGVQWLARKVSEIHF